MQGGPRCAVRAMMWDSPSPRFMSTLLRTMNQLLSDLMMLLLLGRTPEFHIEEDAIIVLRV